MHYKSHDCIVGLLHFTTAQIVISCTLKYALEVIHQQIQHY